jgi:tRNA (guanine37-N1)-methyltransferase
MRIVVFSIFPEMFAGPFGQSIIKRAIDQGLVDLLFRNPRDWSTDKHRTVDDAPFGGGAGMVMKPDPIFAAVEETLGEDLAARGRVLLVTPSGRPFSQALAEELSREEQLSVICGHYEGIDQRVAEHLATDEISIGDFVITSGELAAMVIVDAVVRLIPGVISANSLHQESFSSGLLEYPQYTRPADFRGWRVPDMLLSGNHAAIDEWRRRQSILLTARRRPELLDRSSLTANDAKWLDEQLAESKAGAPGGSTVITPSLDVPGSE